MNVKILLDEIVQYANVGLISVDLDGVITYINRQSENIVNIDSQKDIGKYLVDIIPLNANLVKDCLIRAKEILGYRVICMNKELIWNISPIFRSEKVIGAVCNFNEFGIFEKSVKNFESYNRLNCELETIFNASSDGIWVCDGKGVVIRINKSSEILNGIEAKNVIGKNVKDLLSQKIFNQSVSTKVLDSGRKITIMQYIGKTGKYLLSTGTPAINKNGKIIFVVVNERDITELNSLRKQIKLSQKITEKYKEELADLSLLELKKNKIIANSNKMRHILQMALKLSRINVSNILILGESGTGKGLLAKFIHKNSNRHNNPFVEINCAALPEGLLEAELFGYEKGAFTGASDKGKIGLFELAQGGTLFLDEIGDMPLALQAKLLKYLDDNEIRRVGGTQPIVIDCSTIAATNKNLNDLVKQKKFREDLFYRLNSFNLRIPPIRERSEDIAGLVRFYLNKYNRKYGSDRTINSRTMHYMRRYGFPGNIRELKNIIENAVVMSDDNRIDEFIQLSLHDNESTNPLNLDFFIKGSLRLCDRIGEVEKKLLLHVKSHCRNTREMAEVLGVSQPTVVRKLKKHKISS